MNLIYQTHLVSYVHVNILMKYILNLYRRAYLDETSPSGSGLMEL